MTNPRMQRAGTVGAMLAVAAIGGCASWWAPKQPQAASSPQPVAASSSPQAVAATKPVVTQDLVKQVQTKLQDAGYYKNQSIDGIWGPRTHSAVQQFQKDHSLTVSGELDAPTLQAMNIVSPQTGDNTGSNAPPPPPNGATPPNPSPPPQNGTAPANPPSAPPSNESTNPNR